MKKNERTIEVLNDLIRINIDRVSGYERASHTEKDADPDARNIFYKMAMESRSYINELHAEVLHMGGAPVARNTISGKIYLFWLDLKAGFEGNDTQSLLVASEYGEQAVQKAYERALDSGVDLSYKIVCLIRDQKMALKKAFDLVKRYRDSAIIKAHHN
ncbi:MAG TPA: PA2169 family four-helix-bundle protein [Puia sp.]